MVVCCIKLPAALVAASDRAAAVLVDAGADAVSGACVWAGGAGPQSQHLTVQKTEQGCRPLLAGLPTNFQASFKHPVHPSPFAASI